MGAGSLTKETVVIAISHSGSNKELLQALEVAKARGARIIAITSYQKSALSQLADITLYTSTRETEFRTEASSSRLAQLSLLDTLYVNSYKSMSSFFIFHTIFSKLFPLFVGFFVEYSDSIEIELKTKERNKHEISRN